MTIKHIYHAQTLNEMAENKAYLCVCYIYIYIYFDGCISILTYNLQMSKGLLTFIKLQFHWGMSNTQDEGIRLHILIEP